MGLGREFVRHSVIGKGPWQRIHHARSISSDMQYGMWTILESILNYEFTVPKCKSPPFFLVVSRVKSISIAPETSVVEGHFGHS